MRWWASTHPYFMLRLTFWHLMMPAKQKALIRFCQKWNFFSFVRCALRFSFGFDLLRSGSVFTDSTYYLFDKIIFYSISNSGILFWVLQWCSVPLCWNWNGTQCILELMLTSRLNYIGTFGMRDNRVYWIILFRKRARRMLDWFTEGWSEWKTRNSNLECGSQHIVCFSVGKLVARFVDSQFVHVFRSFIHIRAQLEFQPSTIDFALVVIADDCLFDEFFFFSFRFFSQDQSAHILFFIRNLQNAAKQLHLMNL